MNIPEVNNISNDYYQALSSPVLRRVSGIEVTLALISHLENTTEHERVVGT